jgi:hypothetical protein
LKDRVGKVEDSEKRPIWLIMKDTGEDENVRDELKCGGYETDGDSNGTEGDGSMGVFWKCLGELVLNCWIIKGRDI